jgi:hypothetical protein
MTEKDKPEIVVNRGVSRLADDEKTNHLQDSGDYLIAGENESDEEIIALSAFGVRRYRGQELMLECRLKDGTKQALAYTYLVKAVFCPEKGIVLDFVGHRVSIEGRNLLNIFKRLVRHEVNFICERESFHDTGDKNEVFVSDIEIVTNE